MKHRGMGSVFTRGELDDKHSPLACSGRGLRITSSVAMVERLCWTSVGAGMCFALRLA